jgi:hypothetical protein
MDDLQDAIEDAQFMNAMHDDTPKPTLQWVFPSLEEVDAYVNKLRAKNEALLEMAGICTNCLGFYLVTSPFLLSITITSRTSSGPSTHFDLWGQDHEQLHLRRCEISSEPSFLLPA